MRLSLLALLLVGSLRSQAQELNCRVSVQVTTVQGIDRSIFQRLENDIAQYLNNRRWTNDTYAPNERIECSLSILIGTADINNNRYEGTAQVQATRPVYGANYQTVTLNFQDKNFSINYAPFTALNFSEAAYNGNLVTLLNYYAYLILGYDYASFSPGGGVQYFQRAQNQVNLASNSGEAGWRPADGRSSRYWLTENLLNNSYRALQQVIYLYHRQGLDQLAENGDTGRDAILVSLEELQKLFQQNPDVYAIRVFLDAKTFEIANLMKGAREDQQQRFLDIVRQVDPSNLGTYRAAIRSSGNG